MTLRALALCHFIAFMWQNSNPPSYFDEHEYSFYPCLALKAAEKVPWDGRLINNHPTTQSNLGSAHRLCDAALHIPILKFLCSSQISKLSLLKLSLYFQHLTHLLLYREISSHQAGTQRHSAHPPISKYTTSCTSLIFSFFSQPPSPLQCNSTPTSMWTPSLSTFSGTPYNNNLVYPLDSQPFPAKLDSFPNGFLKLSVISH